MAEEKQNGAASEANNSGSSAPVVVFSAVKPWLVVEAPKADEAVLFYKAAFGFEEVKRVNHPKRKAEQEVPLVVSAELKLGSSLIIVSDLIDDHNSAPVKSASSGVVLCLETDDVEAAVGKAVAAGAVNDGEISEGEGGGCVGKVKDPYGNIWMICLKKDAADVAAA